MVERRKSSRSNHRSWSHIINSCVYILSHTNVYPCLPTSRCLDSSFRIGIGRQFVQNLLTAFLFFPTGLVELFVILTDAAARGWFFALFGLLFFRRRTLTTSYTVRNRDLLEIPLSDMFWWLCDEFLGVLVEMAIVATTSLHSPAYV